MNAPSPHHSFLIDELSFADIYKLFIGSVIPRPIALVSTQSADGKGNLAPFSFFNAVASNPAVLSFSISARADGRKKDTLRNIEETGQFVINSSNEWMWEGVVGAAAEYPFGVNELEKVGFTSVPSVKISPARVAEAIAHFECEVFKIIPVGDGSPGSANLVLGRVLMAHVRSDALDGTKVNPNVHRPLARLGGIDYATLGEILQKPIPKV